MARKYKRDRMGRFAKLGMKAGKAYARGHQGKGAKYRRSRDRFNSKGVYAKNRYIRKGKAPSKATRVARKVSVVAIHTPVNPFFTVKAGATAISGTRNYRKNRAARKNGFAA